MATSARVSAGQEIFSPTPAQLRKILADSAAYCERLKSMALDFVCREKIDEVSYEFDKRLGRVAVSGDIDDTRLIEDLKVRKTVRNAYLYDYQMIKKAGEYREQRDLLEENGRPSAEKNVRLKTMRVTTEFLVFGPVGFLGPYWQNHFVYAITGRDNLGGRETIVITASPSEVREENYYKARIWVDEKDLTILRVEWEPLSLEATTDKIVSLIGSLKRKITATADYNVVKNGVRFPSFQTVREVYTTAEGKEHIKYEARYSYLDYKFFTVETEVIIKK